MPRMRVHQLAGRRGLQTLRCFPDPYLTTAALSHGMVQGLLRANGTFVFVLCSGRNFLHRRGADGSQHVCTGSSTYGRHYALHGNFVGDPLRNGRVPPTETLGVGVWTGLDLYWSNKCLLYAGNHTVVDSLD